MLGAVDLAGGPAATSNAPDPAQPVQVARLAAEAKPIAWVLEDLLAAGCVYLLTGSAKIARKSWLALTLGAAVSRGAPWLGIQTYARPVLYLALEDGRDRLARRLAAIGCVAPDWSDVPFSVAFGLPGLDRAEKQIQANLQQPILIVIDPLAEFAAARNLDEISMGDMTNALRPYREIAQRTQATVLITHHFRKLGDTMRGSSALQAACDGWCLVKPSDHDHEHLGLDWCLRDSPDVRFGARFSRPNGSMAIERADFPIAAASGRDRDGPRRSKQREEAEQLRSRDRTRVRIYLHKHGQSTIDQIVETLAVEDVQLGNPNPATDRRVREAVRSLLGYGLRASPGRHDAWEVDPAHLERIRIEVERGDVI